MCDAAAVESAGFDTPTLRFPPPRGPCWLRDPPGPDRPLLFALRDDLGLTCTKPGSVEVLGLRWPDVDLDAGTIRVAQALQRVDGKRARRVPSYDTCDDDPAR